MANTISNARQVIPALLDGSLPPNCRLVTSNGTPFLVRVVFEGDRYGRLDCLVHDHEDPLVEFYDASCDDTPCGLFVSRYNLETLINPRDGNLINRSGLLLDTGSERWTLDALALQESITLALFFAYRRQTRELGKAQAKADRLEHAQATVLKESIDLGLLDVSKKAEKNPTQAPAAASLCERLTALDEAGHSPLDETMVNDLAELVSYLPPITALAKAVRQLESLGVLTVDDTDVSEIDRAKQAARNSAADLQGIA